MMRINRIIWGKIPSSLKIGDLLASSVRYERVLLNRLMKFVEEKKLIPEEQFGFMTGCSTARQLLRLMESITEGFQTRQTTIAVFLDISKEYDSTWHTELIYMLIGMGLPGDLINILVFPKPEVVQSQDGWSSLRVGKI